MRDVPVGASPDRGGSVSDIGSGMNGKPTRGTDAESVLGVPAIRVAVCDPRRWFREALAQRLNDEPDIRVLWTMATVEELDTAPWVADVLVLSLEDWINRRTVEALTVLCQRHPDAAVVGLTSGDDERAFAWPRLRRSGVATLVARTAGTPALVDELRRLGTGAAGSGGAGPAGGGRRGRAAEAARTGGDRRVRALLSPREQEVLEWLAAGRTVTEIAAGLGVAPKTVANCKQSLYRKLGVHHQAHAVATGLALGLLVADVHDRAMASWS
jgi:DNA-binding NarL/FixJ family response regulator